MSRENSRFPPAIEWASASERGSNLALGLVVRLIRTFGSGPLGLLRAPCALYFTLFAGQARAASKSYLQRVRWANGEHGAPGFRDVFRHVYSFATALVDRLALWSGSFDDFEIKIHGSGHMLGYQAAWSAPPHRRVKRTEGRNAKFHPSESRSRTSSGRDRRHPGLGHRPHRHRCVPSPR